MILLAAIAVCFLFPLLIVPAILPFIAADIAVVAILLLAVTPFAWRFPFGAVEASPRDALAYLAHALRAAGVVVRETPSELTANLDHGATVKLYGVARDGRTRLFYRANPTALGWLSVIRLPRIYGRVRAWARESAPSLVPSDGKLPGPSAPDDVRAQLQDVLSETHRLAAEASQAEQETYLNSFALLAVSALFVWFLLFLGLSSTSADPDFNRRMATAAGAAMAFTLSVGLPGGWLIRRSRRDRLVRAEQWAIRLRDALRRESIGAQPKDGAEGSLELLLRSQEEIPRWQEASRRAGMSVDPTSWWTLFVLAYFGVDLVLWQAPAFAHFSLFLGAVLGAAGVAILVGGGLYWLRWKRRRDEMLARNRAEVERGYERLRGEMERYLGRP